WVNSGEAFSFEATCRKRDPKDVESFVRWTGALIDGKIAGTVAIRFSGDPLPPDQVIQQLRTIDQQLEDSFGKVGADKALASVAQQQFIEKAIPLASKGREIRFHFNTTSTRVFPVGAWVKRSSPTTARP